jgi:hypothetical protein
VQPWTIHFDGVGFKRLYGEGYLGLIGKLLTMAGKKLQLQLPDELYAQLEAVAGALGIPDPAEAAVIGVAEWVARCTRELEDRDPSQRYFINEALDELDKKK